MTKDFKNTISSSD